MSLQPKLATLAVYLREHRNQLLDEWLGTLRIGMEKPGFPLSDSELRNHFADLLEDLCNQLEIPLTEESELAALKHAESHSDTRWLQGYKLPELLREIAALRTVLIAAVVAHGHTRFSLQEQSLANIIVHRFFDALVVESATLFAATTQEAAAREHREEVARELHDGVCQTLQAGVFELALIRREMTPPLSSRLDCVSAKLCRALDDARGVAHGLAALARECEKGLPTALQAFGEELSHVVPCDVQCPPSATVPARQAFQLFRIAQEAAGNACKHGHAQKISITLTDGPDAFQLQVRDDGIGFDPADQPGAGIGLENMQQRARSIGAVLHVESEPHGGTAVTCILPKNAPCSTDRCRTAADLGHRAP